MSLWLLPYQIGFNFFLNICRCPESSGRSQQGPLPFYQSTSGRQDILKMSDASHK